MRIAFISDIHGNLIALEAVLKEIDQVGVDHIVCLGDVTAIGPQPVEALHRIRELGCPVMMGNHDEWLITDNDNLLVPEAAKVDKGLIETVRDIDAWGREQLDADDLDYVKSFQPWWRLDINPELDLLVFHASPRSNTDMLLADTSSPDLDAMFERKRAAVMVGGHTHLQMIRRWRHMLIVNAGSVGAPFYHNFKGEIRNPWWAEYAMLHYANGNFSMDLRRVSYDVDQTMKVVQDSGMPHQDWWIGARD